MHIKCRQFIDNHFSEMVRDLAAIGYQAVAKDWEACDC